MFIQNIQLKQNSNVEQNNERHVGQNSNVDSNNKNIDLANKDSVEHSTEYTRNLHYLPHRAVLKEDRNDQIDNSF